MAVDAPTQPLAALAGPTPSGVPPGDAMCRRNGRTSREGPYGTAEPPLPRRSSTPSTEDCAAPAWQWI
eukprot:1559305-Alexandrium_andersonii.AAC.1